MKKRYSNFIEKLVYGAFLFLFKRASILKKSATDALMNDLPDLNIFNSLLKFYDCGIIDIMTPRMEICAVSLDSSRQEIIEKVKNVNHTKIPVYKNNVDNIIGFLYMKDVIFSTDETFNLKHIIQNVIFVPPSMRTTNLFIKMKSSRSYLAIVLDEYGGTDGLISMTDLIEEIIPSFDNENDANPEYAIVKLNNNRFEISARVLIKDIEEDLNIELRDSEEDYATVGGLILSIAGKVPSTDEVIEYKNGIRFVIKDANERYINKVILDLGDYKNSV